MPECYRTCDLFEARRDGKCRRFSEGIETIDEYNACKDLGVDLIQGYYIAHPHQALETGDAEAAKSLAAYRAAQPAR